MSYFFNILVALSLCINEESKYGFVQATEGGGRLRNWGRTGKVSLYAHYVVVKADTQGYWQRFKILT